ncbi:hypothetical protein CBR_g57653 [Chara braunii]|uniref:Uncharacterized protein n=1 Tax=Chara braunii TaxID=69332 RepID=A0A388MEH6_CHABU|nr:hypothetical protein CBR_g57653 [Chara braunii]|eukprot:GBG92895.1 hypothetical protein CBR_g57653 [Chara braunii]
MLWKKLIAVRIGGYSVVLEHRKGPSVFSLHSTSRSLIHLGCADSPRVDSSNRVRIGRVRLDKQSRLCANTLIALSFPSWTAGVGENIGRVCVFCCINSGGVLIAPKISFWTTQSRGLLLQLRGGVILEVQFGIPLAEHSFHACFGGFAVFLCLVL